MAGGPDGTQEALVKGARITGDQRSSLAGTFGARYAAGESIRSIAQDSGRSYGFVHGVLKESGASLRGRGGATRGPRRTPVDKVADQVRAAVDAVASPARAKAKASKSADKTSVDKTSVDKTAAAKNGAAKNGSVKVAAKNAKAKVKDDKPKKRVEAKKSGKKSGKKG